MAITNETNEVIELAKASAMAKIKGDSFFETDTPKFFNGLIDMLKHINETIDIKKMKDLTQPNYQPIYMLMKASKNNEINHLVFALDEDDFRRKNIHSLVALDESITKKEVEIIQNQSQQNMQNIQ